MVVSPQTWREYYRHRFISDLELWEARCGLLGFSAPDLYLAI
jgi:hypothetical protein